MSKQMKTLALTKIVFLRGLACAALAIPMMGARPAQAQAPGPNLLKNGDFNYPTSWMVDICGNGVSLSSVAVPAYWSAFWACRPANAQTDVVNRTPEYNLAGLEHPDNVHTAPTALRFFNFQSINHSAGVQQTVQNIPINSRLRFSMWVRQWSSNNDSGQSTQDGALQARICIDQLGRVQVHPVFDANTVCSGWTRQYDNYFQLTVEGVTKTGWATVILDTDAEYPVKHNDTVADDASLVVIGAGSAPAPAPVPTQPPAAPAPQSTSAPVAPAPVAPVAPAAAPAGQVIIAVDQANLRDAPSLDGNVIAQAGYGLMLKVVGSSSDGNWWKVSHSAIPGGVAWVSNSVVTSDGSSVFTPAPAPSLPAAPQSTPATISASTRPMLTIATQGARLLLRTLPSETASTYGSVLNGTKMELRGVSADNKFYRVATTLSPNGMAWVMATWATPDANAQKIIGQTKPMLTVVKNQVGARISTNLSSRLFSISDSGAEFEVIGKSANGLWWKVKTTASPDGTAWVYALSVAANAAADAMPVVK